MTFEPNHSNTVRPRDRPRSFDETGALEKATQVFRFKGYEGVTISAGTLRDSLVSFLKQAAKSATEKGSAPGCLLVCLAPLVNDAEILQLLQSAGEIPSDFSVAARAAQVMDFGRGLTLCAQSGSPRKTLSKDAEEAADLVLLPRRI